MQRRRQHEQVDRPAPRPGPLQARRDDARARPQMAQHVGDGLGPLQDVVREVEQRGVGHAARSSASSTGAQSSFTLRQRLLAHALAGAFDHLRALLDADDAPARADAALAAVRSSARCRSRRRAPRRRAAARAARWRGAGSARTAPARGRRRRRGGGTAPARRRGRAHCRGLAPRLHVAPPPWPGTSAARARTWRTGRRAHSPDRRRA